MLNTPSRLIQPYNVEVYISPGIRWIQYCCENLRFISDLGLYRYVLASIFNASNILSRLYLAQQSSNFPYTQYKVQVCLYDHIQYTSRYVLMSIFNTPNIRSRFNLSLQPRGVYQTGVQKGMFQGLVFSIDSIYLFNLGCISNLQLYGFVVVFIFIQPNTPSRHNTAWQLQVVYETRVQMGMCSYPYSIYHIHLVYYFMDMPI